MDNYTRSVETLLKHSDCKKGCKDRCSCKAIGLKCTELCFNFLITVNDIVKHQLGKTCSKLAIEASEKLENFSDVIFEQPYFLVLLLLILNTF